MEQYNWKRKKGAPPMTEVTKDGITWLEFPALAASGLVRHAFSAKLGGVSTGPYTSLNFSAGGGDDPSCVRENFSRMAAALGVNQERMVLSHQTHTANVRLVTEEDLGKGVVRDRDYRDVDGLITDLPGVTLVTLYADCVPLFFLDPKRKAIGLSHSGWRGTVKHMGAETLSAMNQAFGTDPSDVIACIGPSICQDCYEVDDSTIAEFKAAFQPQNYSHLFYEKPNGHFQLNLWEANRIILKDAGIPENQITVTDICTRCNSSLLFSHRAMGPKRGNLGAFLCLI